MSNLEKLVIRPMFYDALSGVFKPETDELKREHTLGRLAQCTFLKGTFVEGKSDEVFSALGYTPTWAKTIVSTVVYSTVEDSGLAVMHSLYLEDKSKDNLELKDAVGEGLVVHYVDDGRPDEAEFPYVLSDSELIKNYVAERAQEFFESAWVSSASR
jgi:hypothetical protein